MSTIIVPAMERKGKGQGAFGTQLLCPYCQTSKWQFVEKAGACRIRYRCKVCHKTIVYEYSDNPGHPYEAYGKSKWQRLVEQWKGTHPKGMDS